MVPHTATLSSDGLLVRAGEVRPTLLVPPDRLQDGAISSSVVFGRESSLIVATRHPGYHSLPHVHDAEQLNWVLEGELWIFVGHDGFLAKRGDFFRIPRNEVHWSLVQGESACTLVELHTPALAGDPWVRETASPLLRADEDPDTVQAVPTAWPDHPEAAGIEEAVMRRHVRAA